MCIVCAKQNQPDTKGLILMNRKPKELKRMARETLNQRYHIPMTAFFLSTFITLLIETPFSLSMSDTPSIPQYIITYAAEFLISLIAVILGAGTSYIHLNMARKKEASVKQLFFAFKQHPDRYIGAGLLTTLLAVAGLLPFFIGTAIFLLLPFNVASVLILIATALVSIVLTVLIAITYAMVIYLLIDYPQMKVTNAFRESRLLMKKKKGRFLYLALSFLGWYLLILLSFGVASLWIIPYQNQTFVQFYLDATGESDRI